MPKKTLNTLVESGNHFVVQVKGNQPKLFEDLQAHTQNYTSTDVMSEDKNGIETTWKAYIFPYENVAWKPISTAVMICKTVLKNNILTETKHFYVSDKKNITAKEFNQGIRGHWGIENQAHKIKDVVFEQDKNKVKNNEAAVNRAVLNTVIINFFVAKYGDFKITYNQIKFVATFKDILSQKRN